MFKLYKEYQNYFPSCTKHFNVAVASPNQCARNGIQSTETKQFRVMTKPNNFKK